MFTLIVCQLTNTVYFKKTPSFATAHPIDFTVQPGLNREHLKYLRSVYCVMTNHSKDQDMRRTSCKTTN